MPAGALSLQVPIKVPRLAEVLARLQDEGLVAPGAAGSLVPTQRGWLMGNEVFGAIWGLA